MFEKIKNYFKGLFVDKRQETLLKTIKVWDDALDTKATEEPEDIKIALDTTISDSVNKQRVQSVGLHFVKFCSKWNLVTIADKMTDHGEYLGATYK